MSSAFGKSRSNRGSLILMFSVLTLFFVYLANIAPPLRIFCLFVSSIFILGIMMEHRIIAAFVSFFAVLFVGFLIVPDKAGMLPFMFFFGHYGIFKFFVDDGLHGATNVVVKLVYFFVGMTLIYFFDGGFIISSIPFELPVWLLAVIGGAVFLVYEWLFTKLAGWYYQNARIRLLGGRA